MRGFASGEDRVGRVWRCALLAVAVALALSARGTASGVGTVRWRPDEAVGAKPAGRKAAIDVLPYFLQGDDRREEWTLGGVDMLPGRDPEGSRARTYVEAKFHSRDFYEVFKLTRSELQIRYEVYRPGGSSGEGNWIRRFEEIGGEGDAPGSVWMRRRMVAGERVTTRCRIDRFRFDTATRSYVHDPAGSVKDLTIVISVHEADVAWPEGDRSGFGIRRVLRLVSDWHPQGQVIETYDYARGKGMVGWRWLERISTLPADTTLGKPNLCRCVDGSGLVEVVATPNADDAPAAYRCDPKTGARGAQLTVVRMDSAFRKDLGSVWYVVFRDLSKEGPMVRKDERIAPTYDLPEWTSRPKATIADLPYVNTSPARAKGDKRRGG